MILFYNLVTRSYRLLFVGCTWRLVGSLTGPTPMTFILQWRNLMISFLSYTSCASETFPYSLWPSSACGSWGTLPGYYLRWASDSPQVPASSISVSIRLTSSPRIIHILLISFVICPTLLGVLIRLVHFGFISSLSVLNLVTVLICIVLLFIPSKS